MFEIEDDFVPPENNHGGLRTPLLPKLPLADLKVGQSFTVPHETMKYSTAKVRAWRYSHSNGVQLRVFRDEGATRIYRAK